MLPSAPVNSSSSKDDISGSDRPSAAAAAGSQAYFPQHQSPESLVGDTRTECVHCCSTAIIQVKKFNKLFGNKDDSASAIKTRLKSSALE
ncbi:hypothetical protein OS493_020569 [Desmophyllum pertusum]|uniref:Uncharacterized protein n=1 Tax=Desmophyllum pertusum TaxID=174260 RepID=A0A9W9Z1W1_9CNID|nr:hypothetical protein OS493_020569 [Desmophyllum pertusum]